jgi:hypothetical protein|eukprot:COSAG06_NODE_850_length_11961_cov_34.663126_2_plen_212_part_00
MSQRILCAVERKTSVCSCQVDSPKGWSARALLVSASFCASRADSEQRIRRIPCAVLRSHVGRERSTWLWLEQQREQRLCCCHCQSAVFRHHHLCCCCCWREAHGLLRQKRQRCRALCEHPAEHARFQSLIFKFVLSLSWQTMGFLMKIRKWCRQQHFPHRRRSVAKKSGRIGRFGAPSSSSSTNPPEYSSSSRRVACIRSISAPQTLTARL